MNDGIEAQRRALLKGAAGIAVSAGLLQATNVLAAAAGERPRAEAIGPASKRKLTPGKPGDFDWLSGEWRIRHRQLKQAGSDEWDEFDGEATCWSIIGGVGHVEELRIPARNFAGMGLRLLDLESKVWSDYWVNAKSGVLGAAGLTGSFEHGEGLFESEYDEDGVQIIGRGIWDRIVPGKSHRWYQCQSRDGGKTWRYNWFMDWTRAG